jgi:hypothetical protein
MGTARVTFLINEKGVIEETIDKVKSAHHAAQILGNEIPAKGKTTAIKESKKSK